MADRPTVSVVVPAHNASRTIGLQLDALGRQLGAPAFEVLVVDNRSTDGVDRVVAEYAERVRHLRLVTAPAHPGAGYARNVGAREAQADRLLFCDADDLVAPDWVAAGVDALGEIDLACGSDLTLRDEEFTTVDDVWRLPFFASPTPSALRRPAGPEPYPIVLGGNLAVRRDAFVRIGGFDVSMRLGNEDNDFAVRAQQAGHLINRAPAMRIAIRQRGTIRENFRRARIAGRGHVELCDRHGLRDASPYLRGSRWRLGPARSVLAATRMLTRPSAERDWPGVATRLGASLGMWQQDLGVRLGRSGNETLIGLGLDREDQR